MTAPRPDSPPLIAALRAALSADGQAELAETHISWVLLAGDRAYKIKKPVDLGFAEFSTLDRRRRFCEEEIRLNRRLAPQLYLGVQPITGSPSSPSLGGAGEPIEYAVAMRRFPQDRLLSRLLPAGGLTPEHVDRLAETIAAFHANIPAAPADGPLGSPERVWRPVEENFRHVAPGIDDPLLRSLETWARAEFAARRDAFARRKAEGFVRECHGDMHLGNMVLLDGEVVTFDGIEFNDDLRWIDLLSEAAFVVMDLEDRGRPDLARRLLNAYLEHTGDYLGLPVLRFYLAYRAMVRAKVASIRSCQPHVAPGDAERLREECRGYLRLAGRYADPGRPSLTITHGLSGSGKTTVTGKLLEATGAIRLRSDVERKRLAGLRPLDRGPDELYAPESSARTYARLADLAETALAAGFPAVIDATFLRRGDRETFRRLAERAGVPFVILDLCADEAALRSRLAARRRDASDAGPNLLAEQIASREPLTPDELRLALPVETDDPASLARALATLVAPNPTRRP